DNRAQIVVDGRAGFLPVLGPALAEGGEPGVGRTQPPRCACRHGLAGRFGFVSEVPVSEFRVVSVGVEEGVGPIRFGDVGFGNRCFQPPVVGLAGELQNPARHRNGDSVGGELSHERVEPFDGRFACDRYAAARRRTSFSCSSRRVRRRSSRSSVDSSVVLPGLLPASISAWRTHLVMVASWTPKSLAIWAIVVFLSRPITTRTTSSR